MVTISRLRVGSWARRTAVMAALVGAVLVARKVVGPWITAGPLAGMLTAAFVVAWSRIEARAFAPRATRCPSLRSGPVPGDHLAFARALAAVAHAYLTECERQEQQR